MEDNGYFIPYFMFGGTKWRKKLETSGGSPNLLIAHRTEYVNCLIKSV